MDQKLTVAALKEISPLFKEAGEIAKKMSTDDLLEKLENVKYDAFGIPAVMLYKLDSKNYWEAGLRNEPDWKGPQLTCKGKTAKDALIVLYAWCVHKGYLKI
jgi:hypothetical protein